jgi:hypothetical protein
VAVIGAAASAEHRQVRQLRAQARVSVGELAGIAGQ